MAQLWTTGGALIYVGLGTTTPASKLTKSPIFLGVAETKPVISVEPAYSNEYAAHGGEVIPFDYTYQGKHGSISLTLSSHNADVIERVKAATPDWVTHASTWGENDSTENGTLMGQEGFLYPIWIVFPRMAAITAMSTYVPGYRFWGCMLQNHSEMPGTKSLMPVLNWRAHRVWTNATYPTGAMYTWGGTGARFILADNVMSETDNANTDPLTPPDL